MVAAFRELNAAYSSPQRAYHTWQHIHECLNWLDWYAVHVHDRAEKLHTLEYAVFYHDIVYLAGHDGNEEESARVARSRLRRLELPPHYPAATSELVRATKHGGPSPAAPDKGTRAAPTQIERTGSSEMVESGRTQSLVTAGTPVIRDIDLAILGAPWERFLEYDEQIRTEFSHLDAVRFRSGRRSVLGRFLAAERIYRTEHFYDRLERQARSNIAALLRRFYS